MTALLGIEETRRGRSHESGQKGLRAGYSMKRALAILAILLSASTVLAQRPPQQALTVEIAAEPLDRAGIRVALSFRNPNAVPMRLWMGFTPRDGNPRGDWFRISADGQPVPYIGPLAKRRAPDAGEFQLLPPGEKRVATMNLVGLYDLPRRRQLTVRFEAYDPSIGDQPLSLLVSNEARITLP
jgi:peptidyl-Lys metalloendopeptidase